MIQSIIIACVCMRHDFTSYLYLFLCLCFTGINVVKRKLAAHDNLKIILEQTGDKFHIKESSAFRTLELDFTLGVKFEYSLADGTELSVSTSVKDTYYLTLDSVAEVRVCL